MRMVFTVLISSLLISGLHAETNQQRAPIKASGESVIIARSAKFNVRVAIMSHEVQIGKSSDKRPDVIRTSCTYSRFPCSIVDYIDISVNDRPINVPRSVFCDLADLNTGEIKIEPNELILTLIGGDASESYIVKLYFDAERVKRTVSTSGMLHDQPLQETTYYRRVLGD